MGRIPQRFIDDLLARTDIVEVIESYVPLRKRGREHVACCPFHNEKTPSFTVSQDKQFYHCFGCGAHGTALGFVLDYERLDFVAAVEELASRIGVEVPREGGDTSAGHHQSLYQVLDQAARLYRQALRETPRAIDYLKSRGISGKVARDYGLGYAPPNREYLSQRFGKARLGELAGAGLIKLNGGGQSHARFRNRIMFPIHDRRGRVIGFGGRVLDDSQPKYLNSPDTPLFHKGAALYGLFELRKAQAKPRWVLLVEGYMDVLALAQQGVQNVVATLGTATTREHLQQLFRATQEIVFCFDGDRAGRAAGWRAVQQLLPVFRDGLGARFMFLPQGDDPDSLIRREGKDAFLKRTESATPLSAYIFKHLADGLDTGDAAGRARLAELAKPLLQGLPEGVFKELMYRELARQTGASLDKLISISEGKSINRHTRTERLSTSSPVRMAIAMLLNEPKLAQEMPPAADLSVLKLPGVPLLVQILETLRTNPHLNSASLLERYRDSEHQRHLLKLMMWRPPASDDFDLAVEFRCTMASLYAKAAAQRTDRLLEKERKEGLNSDERRELQDLFERKMGTFTSTRPAR